MSGEPTGSQVAPNGTPQRSNGVAFLCVTPSTTLLDVLRVHAGAKERGLPAGIALVVDERGGVIGTITDGDVRRVLLRLGSLEARAADAMNADPIVFPDAASFREIMERLPAELERRGRLSRLFLGKIVMVDGERRPVRVLEYHHLWEQRVATHRHVVIVGLGYVGLTLALVMADTGYQVTGVELDPDKVAALARGESYVHEAGLTQLLREHVNRSFRVTLEMPPVGDVFVLAVGTPVRREDPHRDPEPDLGHVRQACELVGRRLRAGALVVLRSTVPVGTTRGLVLPLLEALSGLKAGQDFHLAFAPERTLEGKALAELRALPQVIGGLNEDSVEATVALFRELTPTIVRVPSLEAAELVKLVNNSFRDVIFAFANEVAQISAAHGVEALQVIAAANQGYPRDPVPMPSPGVGGPCLTKDPYILASAARQAGLATTLSLHGRRVNESMHDFVADAVLRQLVALGKEPARCDLLVCGLAFKGRPETGDLRHSSAVEIASRLATRVKSVAASDPVVAPADLRAAGFEPVTLPRAFADKDAVLFLSNHPSFETLDAFEMARALRPPGIVYDGWALFHADDILAACPCVYMGVGFARSSLTPPQA